MAIKSSHIKDVKHEGKSLRITFANGKTYNFEGDHLTPDFYQRFMAAPSKGTFFHRFIKPRTKGTLVNESA